MKLKNQPNNAGRRRLVNDQNRLGAQYPEVSKTKKSGKRMAVGLDVKGDRAGRLKAKRQGIVTVCKLYASRKRLSVWTARTVERPVRAVLRCSLMCVSYQMC